MYVYAVYRIIEPLASRCAKFRFKPLPAEIMSNRITHICNEEGLNLDSEVFFFSFTFLMLYTQKAFPPKSIQLVKSRLEPCIQHKATSNAIFIQDKLLIPLVYFLSVTTSSVVFLLPSEHFFLAYEEKFQKKQSVSIFIEVGS